MRIIHHIADSDSPEVTDFLRALRLDAKITPPVVTFDIDEADERWPAVRDWAAGRKAGDTVRTEFSRAEVTSAEWLVLSPSWHHGYPQPEKAFGYRAATYDPSQFCEVCGVGLRQREPFRMTREPRWGRRNVLQLNWVFDEYFVTPELWAVGLKPLGVAARPVLDKAGHELQSVVQLVVEERVELALHDLPGETCPRCHRLKLASHVRGYFPSLRGLPSAAIVRTREYFGSGASAFNEILVSKELARSLLRAEAKGISFTPVAPT